MAQQDFKHISIEDDDEEVIVVGARAVKPAAAPDPEPAPAPAPTTKPAPAPAQTVPAEDDLEVPPMSLLQKVIIGVALVGVVILVAYLVMA